MTFISHGERSRKTCQRKIVFIKLQPLHVLVGQRLKPSPPGITSTLKFVLSATHFTLVKQRCNQKRVGPRDLTKSMVLKARLIKARQNSIFV